jgi:hypothetical protein
MVAALAVGSEPTAKAATGLSGSGPRPEHGFAWNSAYLIVGGFLIWRNAWLMERELKQRQRIYFEKKLPFST